MVRDNKITKINGVYYIGPAEEYVALIPDTQISIKIPQTDLVVGIQGGMRATSTVNLTQDMWDKLKAWAEEGYDRWLMYLIMRNELPASNGTKLDEQSQIKAKQRITQLQTEVKELLS